MSGACASLIGMGERKLDDRLVLFPLGERGWLLRIRDVRPAWPAQWRLLNLAEHLRALPEVESAVVGDLSLAVVYRHWAQAQAAGGHLQEAYARQPDHPLDTVRLHRIPVVFDGEDLAPVACRCGLPEHELVEQLLAISLRVRFTGFLPGFAYLDGLPEHLHLPRRPQPRAHVPAGSLALAGGYAAIYPFASPGGWHLLGRTTLPLFDANRRPPGLLQPGDEVRLVMETMP